MHSRVEAKQKVACFFEKKTVLSSGMHMFCQIILSVDFRYLIFTCIINICAVHRICRNKCGIKNVYCRWIGLPIP